MCEDEFMKGEAYSACNSFPKKSSSSAWILILVGIIVLGLTSGTLWFLRARNTPSQNSCINNLRQIDGAKQQWALENHKTTNDLASWDQIVPYLKQTPHCPQGGTYTLARVGQLDSCSFPEHARLWKEMNE